MRRSPPTLALLSLLYVVQGLPFGFQANALPVYLRTHGVSLGAIGLATALALPWSLKAFVAPFVDRHFSPRVGPRKSWILPMQASLALTAAVAAWVAPSDAGATLLALVFLMNVWTATMDIAVDGLAIDLLKERALGYGNTAQVVGYKLGMLGGGGLLAFAAAEMGLGWRGLFGAIALISGLAMLPTAWFDEHALTHDAAPRGPGPSLREVMALLKAWLRERHAWWLVAFVATYKFGEAMADTMWKPFLVDAGFSARDITLWVGTWGVTASLLGSFVGGVCASRWRLGTAVAAAALFRVLPIAGEWWVSLGAPTPSAVIAVTVAEHFFGGALTTAVFALMMSRVNRRIGATHYTALASLEVLGKYPPEWASGFLAQHFGYSAVFGAATGLSFLFLALVPRAGGADSPQRKLE